MPACLEADGQIAQLHRLGREQRAERSEERMEFAARGLGVLTVLLGVIAAYIRLDEWTKGYYTRWLAVGAAGFLTAVGLSVWLWS